LLDRREKEAVKSELQTLIEEIQTMECHTGRARDGNICLYLLRKYHLLL